MAATWSPSSAVRSTSPAHPTCASGSSACFAPPPAGSSSTCHWSAIPTPPASAPLAWTCNSTSSPRSNQQLEAQHPRNQASGSGGRCWESGERLRHGRREGPPSKSSRPHAPSGHCHGRDDRDARILQIRKGLREFRRAYLAGGKDRLAQLLYGQPKEACGERSSAPHDRAAPLGLHILQACGNQISHRAPAVFAVDRARRLEVAHRCDEDVPDGDRVT